MTSQLGAAKRIISFSQQPRWPINQLCVMGAILLTSDTGRLREWLAGLLATNAAVALSIHGCAAAVTGLACLLAQCNHVFMYNKTMFA